MAAKDEHQCPRLPCSTGRPHLHLQDGDDSSGPRRHRPGPHQHARGPPSATAGRGASICTCRMETKHTSTCIQMMRVFKQRNIPMRLTQCRASPNPNHPTVALLALQRYRWMVRKDQAASIVLIPGGTHKVSHPNFAYKTSQNLPEWDGFVTSIANSGCANITPWPS